MASMLPTWSEDYTDDGLTAADGGRGLIWALRNLGVEQYAGVNGGGIIHLTKHLPPLNALGVPAGFLTVGEYIAGFVPLGSYIGSGRVAGVIVTTGAASQLVLSGLADALYHDIPAVYVLGLNPAHSEGLAPLQDVTASGTRIIEQLNAVLGEDGCVAVTGYESLRAAPFAIARRIRESRPCALLVEPEILAAPLPASVAELWSVALPALGDRPMPGQADVRSTAASQQLQSADRVVILVTEEASRESGIADLLSSCADQLHADVMWTVNGAAAVDTQAGPHMIGYLGFGGTDRANEVFRKLDGRDTLLCLGFEPGEYVLNLEVISAGLTIHVTSRPEPYGSVGGGFAHRCSGEYLRVASSIGGFLSLITDGRKSRIATPGDQLFHKEPQPAAKPSDGQYETGSSTTVNIGDLARRLDARWRPGTRCFDDVCVMYRDRQAVVSHPSPHVSVFSSYQGSAMGGAFGYAVGAKLADPASRVFCFTGDGCFRLYAGALSETRHLGLNLFLLDNRVLGIVGQGLTQVFADLPDAQHHADLEATDYDGIASAQGWRTLSLLPDLSNLDAVLDDCYDDSPQSLLITVPTSRNEEHGINPRLRRL